MILQSTDKLEEYIGNKYSLVIVAAKRARQIKQGHSPLAWDSSPNPISIALREIEEHKLQPIAPPAEEEVMPATREVITSLVTGAEFDLDEELDLDDGDAVEDLAALLIGADEEEEAATSDTEEETLADTDTEDEDTSLDEDEEDSEDEDEDLDVVDEDSDEDSEDEEE